jgi:hypothetical protein
VCLEKSPKGTDKYAQQKTGPWKVYAKWFTISCQGKGTVKAIFENINQMQTTGIIGKYAIGGAVGATFYLEPSATLDVDIFVTFPMESGQVLLTLTLIYDYLQARGGKLEGECIVVDGWPVQFLPPADALDREAVTEAIETDVEGVRTCVMSAEHLVAIALRTGRLKDHNRVLQFIEQKAVDENKMHTILQRHDLVSKWEQFQRRYLGGGHE